MGRFGFPVLLELAGRRCVVVGERAVEEGKVEHLLAGGADDVLVLAAGRHLDGLSEDPRVRVELRPWRPEDLDGAFLVIGSPGPGAEALAAAARRRGALVNVLDDIANCDWAAPGVVRRGDLTISVSTGGRSPALTHQLRVELEGRYGPEWAEVLAVVGEVRRQSVAAIPDPAERARRWRRALDLEEAAELVRAGRAGELMDRLRARILRSTREGVA